MPHISISQLAAYNLTRIRKALGLSQEQAAGRLEPYLGVRWSIAVYSAAERSYAGKRVRQFTAAELAAFAAAFEVPVVYFFLPPKPEDRTADGVLLGNQVVGWAELSGLMFGGKQRGAMAIRVAELPGDEWPRMQLGPEQEEFEHGLAALGIATRARRRPDGAMEDYDPATRTWVKRDAGDQS